MIYLPTCLLPPKRSNPMYGHHHSRCEPREAAPRWGRGRHGGGRFGGGRHGSRRGFGGGGGPRLNRVIGSGELQLIALALISEAPRHGYEIIKLLEEKTE